MLITQLLTPSAPDFSRAADLLHGGGLVAFPTETVYGLGADATNDRAVARIYEAKGRPSFNPLIVHVADVDMARRYGAWGDMADRLAQAFWPGPLTLLLPLRDEAGLSPLVTAGLPNVALRVPDHTVGQGLLRAFGGPIAAPSANPSGRISPTKAAHVLGSLEGRIEAVIDGGACGVGLESTILALEPTPTLLRPGGIPAEAIEAALGRKLAAHHAGDGISAPGQLTSHYAPSGTMRLNADAPLPGETVLGFGAVEADLNLSPAGDLLEAAANLFACLHQLDAMQAAHIAVTPIPETGLGRAINDRLRRAAAPR